MAAPQLNLGKEMFLEVEATPGSGTYLFLCMLDSITYNADKNEEQVVVWDCANPNADPTRQSFMMDAGDTWQVSGKLATNDAAFKRIWPLRNTDVSAKFRMTMGLSTNSGRRLVFDAKLSNWSQQKEMAAIIKFSCNMTAQGASVESAVP